MTTAAADDGHEATGWRWRSAECLVWTTSPEHDSSVMMVMMMMTLTMVNLMLMTMTMMKTMAMMDIGQRAGRGRVERVSCISDLS